MIADHQCIARVDASHQDLLGGEGKRQMLQVASCHLQIVDIHASAMAFTGCSGVLVFRLLKDRWCTPQEVVHTTKRKPLLQAVCKG